MKILIKNGIIIDGSGDAPCAGSILTNDGTIVKILPADSDVPADKVIDAHGHIIAPGFINLHSHSDKSYLGAPSFESMLTGGVTFEMIGQCGDSVIPVSDINISSIANDGDMFNIGLTPDNFYPRDTLSYACDFSAHGASINTGVMIGHGTLRSFFFGMDQRKLSHDELDIMCARLDEELKAGAFGLTLGLIYPPGSCCGREELLALAKVVSANNKILAVHMRNENVRVFEALEEMLDIARETGVQLEISHLKIMGKKMWGRAGELLGKIDAARAEGIRIFADAYPYTASNSALTSCLPARATDGGYAALAEHLKDDAWWDEISDHGTLPEMLSRGGAENIQVQSYPLGGEFPQFTDKTISQIARELNVSEADAVRRVLITCGGFVMCFYFSQNEDDMLRILSRRDVSVISDGTAYEFNNHRSTPHPREVGSFPRAMRLIREHRLMSPEAAVRKVTGLPADIIGMQNKFGYIREGLDADITVFDWDTISDRADYKDPDHASIGIDCVIVNGEVVLEKGIITSARPGRCILAK